MSGSPRFRVECQLHFQTNTQATKMNVTVMLTVLSCMVIAVANADDSGRQLRQQSLIGGAIGT
ncbi:hypothetical protein L915_11582, partial [Phytophthora nicotianae]